jgi:hypothetical protein
MTRGLVLEVWPVCITAPRGLEPLGRYVSVSPLASTASAVVHRRRGRKQNQEARGRLRPQEQAAGSIVHATLTRGTMLPLVNGLAPCSLGLSLVEPQLVTPTTTLGFG